MRFLLYIAVIGLAVYLLIALIQRRGRRSGGSPRPGSRPTPGPRPGRPVAPDDDPAFLAELDRKRRAAERKAAEGGTPPPQERGPTGAGTPASEDPAAPSDDGAVTSGEASGPADEPDGESTTPAEEPDGDSPDPGETPDGQR